MSVSLVEHVGQPVDPAPVRLGRVLGDERAEARTDKRIRHLVDRERQQHPRPAWRDEHRHEAEHAAEAPDGDRP